VVSATERRELELRYKQAVRRAEQWLAEQGRSQSWLAEKLGVERSVLSRFLSGEERYKPSPGRRRVVGILEGIEQVCRVAPRDIFLSHRASDKAFVRRLAADIESQAKDNRRILTWLDEAEIGPGQSIPRMVNEGLETSRFVGLVMTPAYFAQGSGWTDAEWHSALHVDPDNRRAKLLPLLVEDCPYVPALLRHLLMIDFRGKKYDEGLDQLLRVLRDEPRPRPMTYRGQLIESKDRVDRATLIAERAVPEADPDPVPEKAYCNLLPIERLPQYIYRAPISREKGRGKKVEALPSKRELRDRIYAFQERKGGARWLPAFRLDGDSLVTFHDLDSSDSLLRCIVNGDDAEVFETRDFLANPIGRNIVVSLVTMALSRHLHRNGLTIDESRFNRFFFPPNDGKERVIEWVPAKNTAKRTVTKPYLRAGQPDGWMHHACYIKAIYFASRMYVQLTPTRVLTHDGVKVKTGPKVGRIVVRWLGQERNLHVLYNVRFWTSVLRSKPGPIAIQAGDQWIEVAKVPAFIQQAYGIVGDQKDLLGLLDREASMISRMEDKAATLEEEAQSEDEDSDGHDEEHLNGQVEET
jgi:transcriptional regulator with XRE-family HTH domain